MEWARPYLSSKRRIFRVLDARIEGQYSLSKAMKVASLALQCLSGEPKLRPDMDEVVKALEQLQDAKDPATAEENKAELTQHGHLKGQSKSCRGSTQVPAPITEYPRPSSSPLYT